MSRRSMTMLLAMVAIIVVFATAAYARNNVHTITCTGGSCQGTARGDVIDESSGDDQIYGMAGADQIYSGFYSGDTDVLSGGEGSDYVDGGDLDTLDTVAGDEGANDTCVISENLTTGARDTLGGGCETVLLYSLESCECVPNGDPDFAGCDNARRCMC
jgi:hypothetical protein